MSVKRAIVLGGKTGLLGQAVRRELLNSDYEVFSPTRQELNIFSEYDLANYIDSCRPDILFNAVAYTQVDKAEEEPEKAKLINEGLCTIIAGILKTRPCRCVSISTDFVFDGKKEIPYSEQDVVNPKSVYGKTKLAGEFQLLSIVPEKVIIARTAWLFGPHKINFVQKILQLAKEREALNVVADQTGSPTFTLDLAKMCVRLACFTNAGVFHLVNSGKSSWYELAAAAVEMSGIECSVLPIKTKDFPQLAPRPSYSVLSNQKYIETVGETPREWKDGLAQYLTQLQTSTIETHG